MDQHVPRGGRVLEELGTYDPTVADTDARAILRKERIDYWLSVGAQPTDNVRVLIKKYGTAGTHLDKQEAALDRLAQPRAVPDPGPPASVAKSIEELPPAPPATPPPDSAVASQPATADTPGEGDSQPDQAQATDASVQEAAESESASDSPQSSDASEASTEETGEGDATEES